MTFLDNFIAYAWLRDHPYLGFCTLLLCYIVTSLVYNAYFHPLSMYPGSILFTSSRLPGCYHAMRGTMVYKVAELHDTYGPVVRVGPNALSYIDADAWTDIFAKTRPQLPKDPMVGPPPPNGVTGLAFAEKDEDHNRMRRNLSHGFSEKALRDQETVLNLYFDLFIEKLKDKSLSSSVDMVDWLNFVTVDIIGQLTFGTSFECLTSAHLHPWMQNIFQFLKAFVVVGILRRFWPIGEIVIGLGKMIPGFAEKEELHRGFINDRLAARLSKDEQSTDFMTYVSKHTGTSTGMSIDELRETCNALMLGGSETTASALSGTIYQLLANPPVLRKLQQEIREAFIKEEDMTITSTNKLRYLQAVLQEGLRIFPPLASQITRITNHDGNMICGKYVAPGTSVTVSHWAAYHSPSNFHQPEEFHPERWLPLTPDTKVFEHDKKKVYQPFSMGPRNCIGYNLAWAEMRMLLTKLVWSFDWDLVEGSATDEWRRGQFGVWAVYEKAPLMVKLREVKR